MLPSVVTWSTAAGPLLDDGFRKGLLCFTRNNDLPLLNLAGSNTSSGLQLLHEILERDRSVVLVGKSTVISPIFTLSKGSFQDYFASYLEHFDIIIPVSQPPALTVIGTYAMYLQRSERSLAFVDSWKSVAALCGDYPAQLDGSLSKAILYAAILKHLEPHSSVVDQQGAGAGLERICSLERKEMHRFFLARCFKMLPAGAEKTEQSVRELLLAGGILFAGDPFSFNAATLMSTKFESMADPDSWKEAALGSLFIHAGGVTSASSKSGEIYLNRLLNLLGFSIGPNGCPLANAKQPAAYFPSPATKSSQFWHLVSKGCMIVMLLWLLAAIIMCFLVVVKLS